MAPDQNMQPPPAASAAEPTAPQSLQHGSYCDYYDLTWPSGWQSREVLYHSNEAYMGQSWPARLRCGVIYTIRQLLLTVLALTASLVLVGSQLTRLHRLSSGILKATSIKSIDTTCMPTAQPKKHVSSTTQRHRSAGSVSKASKRLPLDIALVTRAPEQSQGLPQYVQMQLVRHHPRAMASGTQNDAKGDNSLLPITTVQAMDPGNTPGAMSVRPAPPEALVTTDNHGHHVVTEYIDIPPRHAARIHCVSAPTSRRASTSHDDLVVANHDASVSYVLEQSYDLQDKRLKKSRSGRRRLRTTSLLKPKVSRRNSKELLHRRTDPQMSTIARYSHSVSDQAALHEGKSGLSNQDDQPPNSRRNDLGLPTKLLSDGIKSTRGLLGKLGRLSLGGIHGPGNEPSNGGEHRESGTAYHYPRHAPNGPREPGSWDPSQATGAGTPSPPPPFYTPPGAHPPVSSLDNWSLPQQSGKVASNHTGSSDTGMVHHPPPHASHLHPPSPVANAETASLVNSSQTVAQPPSVVAKNPSLHIAHTVPSGADDTSSPTTVLSTASNSTRPPIDAGSPFESGYSLEPRTHSWAYGYPDEANTKHQRLANFHHQHHRHHQSGSSTASYSHSDGVEGDFADGDQNHHSLHHRLLGNEDSHRNRLRRRVKGLFKTSNENPSSSVLEGPHEPSETSTTSDKSTQPDLQRHLLPSHDRSQSDDAADIAAPATVARSSSLGTPLKPRMH
ncbi:hypothetical protein H4R35_003903 [Dimargaris xerosporica]|nr:hypothetical protein H4R35_003903 [Dimargaris xerosporica]